MKNVNTQIVLDDGHTSTQPLHSGFQALLAALDFDPDLSTILHQIASVTQSLNVVSPPNSSIIPMRLRETLRSVQYTLLAKQDHNELHGPRVHTLKTVHLGLLLYAGILQNDFWISPLSSQLRKQVDLYLQSEEGPLTGFVVALRLWFIFLAGPLVLDSTERTLFLRFIAKAKSELALTSWEDARNVLMGFAWVGKIQDVSGQALWDEAVRFRLCLHESVVAQ